MKLIIIMIENMPYAFGVGIQIRRLIFWDWRSRSGIGIMTMAGDWGLGIDD